MSVGSGAMNSEYQYVPSDVVAETVMDAIEFYVVDNEKGRTWLRDFLFDGGWPPIVGLTDTQLQDLYDEWVGGSLRVDTLFDNDKQMELELHANIHN